MLCIRSGVYLEGEGNKSVGSMFFCKNKFERMCACICVFIRECARAKNLKSDSGSKFLEYAWSDHHFAISLQKR